MKCCCYLREDPDLLADGESKWTIFPGHALFARGIWEEDILIAEIGELDKLDVLITQKDGNFIFLVADGSAKLSRRDYEFQEPSPRREWKVSTWTKRRWRRRSGKIWVYSRMLHLLSSYWTESSTYVPREESFFISPDLHHWTKLFREEVHDAWGGLEKSQNIWGKTNLITVILQGKDWILYFITIFRKNSFRWKDLKKAHHIIFFEGESKHTLSCLAAQRICETKILQVNLKIRGVRDTLKCELGKKEVWTPNVVLISELRESRVTCGSEDSGDLSLKDACLGKLRSMNERSFIPSNVDSRWKSDNGKRMKGGHKEGTQKQKVRKVHFVALMDIRHMQKYKYIPVNVRKSNLKCGNYAKLNWDNHWRSGWRLSSMKSYENKFKIILQYKYHHWVFWNILSESWQVVNYELRFTVAQKEENFDNLCCESSQPTVKIRTTLIRRWIFKRASGNRCLHDAGKTWPHRRTAAAAVATAAAIICQYILGQSPTTEKISVLPCD